MDETLTDTSHRESRPQIQQLLPSKWQGLSAMIDKGGMICVVLSQAELANLDLYHLQILPSNTTSAAILEAGGLVSSEQSTKCFKEALPVFKTKAVVDAELNSSSQHISPVPGRSRNLKQKALSMDEVGLYEQLYGRSVFHTGFEKPLWQTKETYLSAGAVTREVSDAMDIWQENSKAKFLLQMMPWELTSLAPLTTFENSAAVPFKWEEVPGKPKPDVVAPRQSSHQLRLPPRLHAKTSPLPLLNRNRRSHLLRILHIILPGARTRKASTSVMQYKNETLQEASGISEETLSPNSILRGFDSQSQASSSSPDIPSTADLSLAQSADNLYSTGRHMECPSLYSDIHSSSYFSSPYTDFGPVNGPKGSRHLYLAVENIKQTMKTWNRNKFGGKRNYRSMDLDNVEVWSPTLAVYYQQHGDEIDATKESETDQMKTGSDNVRCNPRAMQSSNSNSCFEDGMSSKSSFLSCSAPATPQCIELHRRTKRGLRKRIMDKIRKSYITAVQYIKVG